MIFTYLATTVTFRNAPRPEGAERTYLQATAKTTAGIPITQDYRAVTPVITISWKNMPLADRTALETFFETVNVMAKTWTVTFPNGIVLTVRFAEPQLSFTEKAYQEFGCTVRLMVAG